MNSQFHNNRMGFYASVCLAIITLVSLGLAMTAIPISGTFAPQGSALAYPYLDTLRQFPKDYWWMLPAMFLVLSYLAVLNALHRSAVSKSAYSSLGMIVAVLAAGVLLVDYFLQLTVVPASLFSHETEGITLLTQYNPHGIFIALEELGYILMAVSFLFMAPALEGKTRLEVSIRGVFIGAFGICMLSGIGILLKYGVLRQDRLEVIIIGVNWLALIVNGIQLAVFFNRSGKM